MTLTGKRFNSHVVQISSLSRTEDSILTNRQLEGIAVQGDPHAPQPSKKMMEMALALAELRDSWTKMSMVLKDVLTDTQSQQRDEVLIQVERYLTRLREV
jgi:hypothetical protein